MEQTNNTFSQKTNPRDGDNTSIWQPGPVDLAEQDRQPPVEQVYDVLVVGGGITGITTALLLQQQNKKVVVAEAHLVGFGTTGGTSAHLNTFFDATYPEIESDFGENAAKLIADAGKEVMNWINGFVNKYQINCDLETKNAYLFSENEKESKQLDEILESSQKAGIAVEKTSKNGIEVPFKQSILFKDQGQFHPLKYLKGLANEFIKAGGVLLENSFITENSYEDGIHTAKSAAFTIKAKNLVFATHLPPGINLMDFTCAPYRSYVLGVTLADEKYPDCLAYDMQEPYHYFRTHVIDRKKYLLVGGEDHKTGHDEPEKAFETLENYVRKYYNISSVDFKWSSQYYIPADGLPYIGHLPSSDENIYMATGYNGNGMIFGTLSAMILCDLICGKNNRYSELLSPTRIKPVAGFGDFVKENSDVAYRFIADRFSAEKIKSFEELPIGTGTIVNFEGEKLAAYKDEAGKISALNPVCPHAGCVVNFNPTEKSWDCPCHGGRFDLDGHVLTGPPRADLQKVI
ncbi:FAD-dependent oxidoreductase [Pedobacter sp. HMF7647]|uniref:FAD-dependent oxidoreductase n=1 Tax=Hufsiella arboris TaxID=2695275 RepID=A0A7K1YEZ4_9SPHI|nr:FAD-dependent oxidoreductase [Hufsiella arboris]MXV53174.1 FAD-dependent oxidoreductase [Hufsiella arboris]